MIKLTPCCILFLRIRIRIDWRGRPRDQTPARCGIPRIEFLEMVQLDGWRRCDLLMLRLLVLAHHKYGFKALLV